MAVVAMLKAMKEELSCVVRGLVQGVGFRWFVQRKAAERELLGWVTNATDGSVHILAQGSRDDLEALIADVRKGPRSAMVHDVTVEWNNPSGEYHTFEIR